ncbi:MAG: hypothetical protein M1404_03465 [Acidobacteria bacterium]|nr:hypothetical protein [Acidobacteriota bacterium]
MSILADLDAPVESEPGPGVGMAGSRPRPASEVLRVELAIAGFEKAGGEARYLVDLL